jgi:hypothetical protein
MTDVKTAPVKAAFLTADRFWDTSTPFRRCTTPGAILLGEEEEDPGAWWYCCPCGCGHVGRLYVGVVRKPPQSPSWAWTGGKEAATLSPSVHHVGHWHGWLKNGVWESC